MLYYLTTTIGLPLGVKYNSLRIPHCFVNYRNLTLNFIRGVFDTDGCISFKKKYKLKPYYPVISLSSKSESFVREIATCLKKEGFKLVEIYNYKLDDNRVEAGFTTINRIELNGKHNLKHWCEKIGFWSPKHNNKIRRYREE